VSSQAALFLEREFCTVEDVMRSPLIRRGHVVSAAAVFLRAAGRLSDPDVFQLLGLKRLHRFAIQNQVPGGEYILITEDAKWIHVHSDWGYSLVRYSDLFGMGIEAAGELSRKADSPVFMFWLGESDDSFSFSYGAAGRLMRAFVAIDQHDDWRRRVVTIDSGIPLPGERRHTRVRNNYAYMFSLAKKLGVETQYDLARLRGYQRPPQTEAL
jgi:hypothetical protein